MLFAITFHGIGPATRPLDPGEDRVWCSVEQMNEILDLVKDRTDVRITCDDGNRSDLEILAPALLERGMTADFFVLAGRLDSKHFLNPEDLRTLRSMGMRIGLHGWDHVPWRRLDEAGWKRELVEAKQRLEACIGEPITTAACPFGAYGRETIRRLRRVGIEEIFTSDGGWSDASQGTTARNSVGGDRGTHTLAQALEGRRIVASQRIKRVIKALRT